jgi:para-aminobenzoate synthetase component 1
MRSLASIMDGGTRSERGGAVGAHKIAYCDPIDAFAPLRDTPMSILLHGSGDHPAARWSYILTAPTDVLTLSENDHSLIAERLRAWLKNLQEPFVAPAPFAWGAAGLIAYEAGPAFDAAMPAHNSAEPLVALGRYDGVIAFDHQKREAFITTRPGADPYLAQKLIASLGQSQFTPHRGGGEISAQDNRAWYATNVSQIVSRIRAGDLFQANLSRRFEGALGAGDHPYDFFARLSRQSPAPFSAYMRLSDSAIVSNSPERFLSLARRGGDLIVTTSPIKGTRPRGEDASDDEAQRALLSASAKDRAENIMIVDLMRNDLSRVSKAGSVRTPKLNDVESFANVHHLVSTVTGALKPGLSGADLLQAAFPAGSITGAPKIQAMHLIHEIEQSPRRANYGALAWFGADGAMESSVLIRTATCTPEGDSWKVAFRTGGGIVADSDPAAETDETETKASALIAAIRGETP